MSSTVPHNKPLWCPKLTGYRALVLTLSASLGVSKVILTYHNSPITSVTLEWIFTVLLGLGVFWLGLYEKDHAQVLPWLFDRDYGRDLARLISRLGFYVPNYRTDESQETYLVPRTTTRPPLTGYHLLVNTFVTTFGLSKAILTYLGFTNAPDVLDWVLALVVSIGLYCLGLYERSSTHVWPAMFERDYGPAFSKRFLQNLAESQFFPYSLGLILACTGSYGVFLLMSMIQPPDHSMDDDPLLLWSWRMIIFSAMSFMGVLLVGIYIYACVSSLQTRWRTMNPGIKRRIGIEALERTVVRPPPLLQRTATLTTAILHAALYVFAHVFGIVFVSAFAYTACVTGMAVWSPPKFPAKLDSEGSVILSITGGALFFVGITYALVCLSILWSLFTPLVRGFGQLLQRACNSGTE